MVRKSRTRTCGLAARSIEMPSVGSVPAPDADLPQWPITHAAWYILLSLRKMSKKMSACIIFSVRGFVLGSRGAQVENSLLPPRPTKSAGDATSALTREEPGSSGQAGFLSLAAPNFQLHLAGILSKAWRMIDCAHQQFAWSRRVLGVFCWQNRPRLVISRWCLLGSRRC